MILGLDISSSCTGMVLIDPETKQIVFKKSVAIKEPSKKSVYEIATTFIDELEIINGDHKITSIYIEEPLKSFTRGASSNNTIIRLIQVNAVVSFMCEYILLIKPIHIPSNTARATLGIKIPKSEKKNKKKKILDKVMEIYPDFEYGLNRVGNPENGTYDIADAIVIALAGLEIYGVNNEQGNNT